MTSGAGMLGGPPGTRVPTVGLEGGEGSRSDPVTAGAGSSSVCQEMPLTGCSASPELAARVGVLSCHLLHLFIPLKSFPESIVGLLLLLLMARLVHLLYLIYSPATPQRKAQPGGKLAH